MDTIIFLLYAIIIVCIWYVFNQYFKDHSKKRVQPIQVNSHANLHRRREHFSTGTNRLSEENIKNMIKKVMNQMSDEDNTKPKVEETKTIETDMELYLIGSDKQTFFKNLQESRSKPTLVEINKTNQDIDSYFGTNKKGNNAIVSML